MQHQITATIEPLILFGPMKCQLPTDVVEYLNRICDSLEGEDYGPYLAAKITHGDQVGFKSDKLDPEFVNSLIEITKQYIMQLSRKERKVIEQQYQLDLGHFWKVSQLAEDFNPVHQHSGLIAGIIYLKIPPQVKRETNHGCLEFVCGRNMPNSLDFVHRNMIAPKVGEMYIFPSWLQHTVYPFYGEGERRSVAFNIFNRNSEL